MWKTFNHNQDLHHMVRNYSLKLEKYHDGRNIRKTQCLTNIIKTCLILASYIVKISFSWYHPLSCRTISVLHIAYLRLIWIGTYLLPVLGCKLLEHRMYKLVSVSNLSASAVVLRRTTELCPSILQKLFAVLHSTELFVYFLFIVHMTIVLLSDDALKSQLYSPKVCLWIIQGAVMILKFDYLFHSGCTSLYISFGLILCCHVAYWIFLWL